MATFFGQQHNASIFELLAQVNINCSTVAGQFFFFFFLAGVGDYLAEQKRSGGKKCPENVWSFHS